MLNSAYSREIKKNEGYSTLSLAFGIMSIWIGLLSNGVPDVIWWNVGQGALGILFAILALTNKLQKKKYYAKASLVLSPIGITISLNAMYHWVYVDLWPT